MRRMQKSESGREARKRGGGHGSGEIGGRKEDEESKRETKLKKSGKSKNDSAKHIWKGPHRCLHPGSNWGSPACQADGLTNFPMKTCNRNTAGG
jgi:hypothetical protein